MGERELMTVARVFEPASEGVEVIFLESARFYKVSRVNPDFESIVSALREAAENGTRVEVVRKSITSDVIVGVKPPG
jgi:hypothetical protein